MQLNDKALDAFMRAMDKATDQAVARETVKLREAGAVLLRVIYDSGIAYDNPEVEAALAVFADQ